MNLSDDLGGDEAVKNFEQNQNNPGGGGFGGGFRGGSGWTFTSGGSGDGINIEDLFGGFFGGGGGGSKRGQGGGFSGGGFNFGGAGGFGSEGFGGGYNFGSGQKQQKKQFFKDSDVLILTSETKYEIDQRRRLVLAVFYSKESIDDNDEV